MILKELKLKNFRNYTRLLLSFGEGIHIIHGENGQGKTNLLESIYYLAITKSFRTHLDKELLNYDQPHFEITGSFNGAEKDILIRTYWDNKNKKNFWKDGNKIEGLQSYIGTLPVVLLIPSDLAVTTGNPGERRRFFNILLAQANSKYLKNLVQYRKLLKSRNLILFNDPPDKALLETFTQKMSELADYICEERLLLIQWLNSKIETIYSRISGEKDKIQIKYKPAYSKFGINNLSYKTHWPQILEKEIRKRRTLTGPQLDDFVLYLNDKPIKQFGSQGENKTAVIALKLCEYFYLYNQKNERPIMLFDDIFGELDKIRINNMLNALGEIAQVFVTTTSPDFFSKLNITSKINYYHISDGRVKGEE